MPGTSYGHGATGVWKVKTNNNNKKIRAESVYEGSYFERCICLYGGRKYSKGETSLTCEWTRDARKMRYLS